MEEEEVVEEVPLNSYIDYAKGKRALTSDKAITNVVQSLCSMKPHELGNHVVIFDEEINQGHVLLFSQPANPVSYEEQISAFGRALKEKGFQAHIVVFVVNGLMPDHMLRPVSVILAMERWGECKQVILDYKDNNHVLPATRINPRDKEICSHLFMAQSVYRPDEQNSAIWN